MNIYLVGYMGSGKSTTGRALSQRMQLPFFDLDDEFEKKYKISIPGFFHKYGEEQFRKLEYALLCELSTLSSAVIATGGGTPCYFESMLLMNTTGMTVYLETTPEILLERIRNSTRKRPVFDVMNTTTALEQLTLHLASRERFYQMASLTADAEHPDLEAIAKMFELKKSAF